MKNKIYLLLLGLLLLPITIAAAPRDCMVVHMQSGANLVFMLEDEPQIVFTENGFDIGLHSLQLSEVVKYTFEDSDHLPEGLSDVIVESDIKIRDGIVVIGARHAQEHVRLFNTLGQQITYVPVYTSETSLVIDLNQLPLGVYLLNVGSETLKIMHR